MDNTTDLPGKQTLDSTTLAAGSKQQDVRAAQTRRRARRTVWVVGLIVSTLGNRVEFIDLGRHPHTRLDRL